MLVPVTELCYYCAHALDWCPSCERCLCTCTCGWHTVTIPRRISIKDVTVTGGLL